MVEGEPAKKKRERTASKTLDGDIVFYNILPRIPLKSLFRFKCVCKSWNRIISNDSFFAAQQSHHSKSSSPCLIALNTEENHLVVLPAVAVPDPTFRFIGDHTIAMDILSSTNGLLCVHCYNFRGEFLYVCNPATMKGTRVPIPQEARFLMSDSVGLAFDPSTSTTHYKLVHPTRSFFTMNGTVEYGFKVFSSRSGEWTESDQLVVVEYGSLHKPVFAGGVVYWYCEEYFLWFDCDNELSGYLLMPEEPLRPELEDVGVYRDRLSVARVSGRSLDVWTLAERSKWEKIHNINLDMMVKCSGDSLRMMRRRKISTEKYWVQHARAKYWLQPLPFEGGDMVYFRMMVKRRYPMECGKKVLSYDIKTGKVVILPDLLKKTRMVFGYNSSLVEFLF